VHSYGLSSGCLCVQLDSRNRLFVKWGYYLAAAKKTAFS
jgi:hypothetical protein